MISALVFFWLLYTPISGIAAPCHYNGTRPPAPGECSGPLERAIAKRENILFFNGGCDINMIYLTNSTIKCGDCLPGTTGNDRFFGAQASVVQQAGIIVKTEYCSTTTAGKVICKAAEFSAVTPSRIFCDLNQYCTAEGKCKSLFEAPTYGISCQATTDCGAGLQCIGRRCIICGDVPDVSVQPTNVTGGVNGTGAATNGTSATAVVGRWLRGLLSPNITGPPPTTVPPPLSAYLGAPTRVGALASLATWPRMTPVCIGGAYRHAGPLSLFLHGGIGAAPGWMLVLGAAGACILAAARAVGWCVRMGRGDLEAHRRQGRAQVRAAQAEARRRERVTRELARPPPLAASYATLHAMAVSGTLPRQPARTPALPRRCPRRPAEPTARATVGSALPAPRAPLAPGPILPAPPSTATPTSPTTTKSLVAAHSVRRH
ncbi:hypothetical protein PAPYR_6473 [Paratrimastix pyriformis]|uniref:Uncharacterized protein n=1 Tax=Paratrimastix pyriformis TaxID=342808 RepID=A0ABQ8UGP0_9EUKA|nr:hypothetical protein PAPYR_6473 [Paratrimastix pyriformis]